MFVNFAVVMQALYHYIYLTNQCSLFMTVRHIFEISEDDLHPRTVNHSHAPAIIDEL
jgi:hypothetical protein